MTDEKEREVEKCDFLYNPKIFLKEVTCLSSLKLVLLSLRHEKLLLQNVLETYQMFILSQERFSHNSIELVVCIACWSQYH